MMPHSGYYLDRALEAAVKSHSPDHDPVCCIIAACSYCFLAELKEVDGK